MKIRSVPVAHPPTADELRDSEARYASLVDTCPDAIVVTLDERIVLVNRAGLELFGASAAEQLLGKSPYELVHPEDHALVRERMQVLLSGVQAAVPWVAERFLRLDGSVRDVEVAAAAVALHGAPAIQVVARDVTERRRAQLALVESEARGRAVLDTVASGIIAIDERGTVQTFNRAAERLFGYPAAEVLGQNVRMLMPAPDRDHHDTYLATYLRTGVAKIIGVGRDVVGRRKDGTTFPMHLAVDDTLLDGWHLFTGVVRDLTAERAAEAREHALRQHAEQQARLADIGVVTTRIAHDFGNPLAGLSMTAQRMLRTIEREPQGPVVALRDAAETLLRTVKRLEHLVAEFKEFAHEQRLELHDVDVGRLLDELVAAWGEEARARAIALEWRASAAGSLVIRADAEKLRRVFDNLVKNAFEAVERGPGVVRLAAEACADGVEISVEDSGPGVPEDTDIFALFETTKAHGTGLGLPICKQIIQAHGGGIAFAARQPKGTVFHVELPAKGPTV